MSRAAPAGLVSRNRSAFKTFEPLAQAIGQELFGAGKKEEQLVLLDGVSRSSLCRQLRLCDCLCGVLRARAGEEGTPPSQLLRRRQKSGAGASARARRMIRRKGAGCKGAPRL
jgi:hypothetical protein